MADLRSHSNPSAELERWAQNFPHLSTREIYCGQPNGIADGPDITFRFAEQHRSERSKDLRRR